VQDLQANHQHPMQGGTTMTPQQKALQDCIEALETIIQSRDSHCFKRERFVESDLGSYWSPSASMIDSDTVAKGRTALTQAKQALDHVPDAGKMVQAQGDATHYIDAMGLCYTASRAKFIGMDVASMTALYTHPQASEPLSSNPTGLSSELVPLSSEPPEADPTAPWLTKAHMLCTDHGVPQGNIEWRIEVLRGLFSNPQASEPVGINGLTQAETDASMSVRGLSNPTASEPAEKRTLYECTGCGHLHNERVSSCDCRENPGNTYNLWTAAPEATE
jgi:hypothetical protein